MPTRPSTVVVITLYNSAPTIAETMASLQTQSFQDWRCLVINDGSTDNGPDIVRGIALHDPRFQLITQPNRGLAGARNRGIEEALATGCEFIHFLDSDDWMTPRGLELLHLAAQETGASYGGYELCDFRGRSLGRQSPISAPYVGLDEQLDWNRTATHAHLFHRDSVGSERFDESLKVVEDYDLWLRLAVRGVRWKAVEAIVAAYRLRPGSMSKNFAAMCECYQRVTAKAMDRARAEGWEARGVDLSERRFKRNVGNMTLTYSTMDALVDPSPEKSRAAAIFRSAARPDRITPAWAAQAATTALPFGACLAPDVDGWSERTWLPHLRDWWSRCAAEGWLDRDELDECLVELSRKVVHPDLVARAMIDAAPANTQRLGIVGVEKFGRRLARMAASGDSARDVLIFDDSASSDEAALLEPSPRIAVARSREDLARLTVASERPTTWLIPPGTPAPSLEVVGAGRPFPMASRRTTLLKWNDFRDRIAAANLERFNDALDLHPAQAQLMVG